MLSVYKLGLSTSKQLGSVEINQSGLGWTKKGMEYREDSDCSNDAETLCVVERK